MWGMWVDTSLVHADNPAWRDLASSCLHEWLGTFMIAVRTPCPAMGLQKAYPPKLAAEPEEGHCRTGLAQQTCGEQGRCGRTCNWVA
jgi:hypothetical protein